MKMAKVIDVRDASPATSSAAPEGVPSQRQRMEQLLRRYPNNEAETEEIKRFLAKGSHLDVGLIAGSDEFRELVKRIREEHGSYFRLKLHEVLIFVTVVAGPVAALFWRSLG